MLLLTAMAEPEDRVNGLEQGADDYLSKPFEPRELVLRIRNLLQRRPAADADAAARSALAAAVSIVARGELFRGGDPIRLTAAEAGAAGEPGAQSAAKPCRARSCRYRPNSAAMCAMSMCR